MNNMLLCFDMDNTLVRANKIHVKAFNKAFMKFSLKKVSRKRLAEHFGKEKGLIVKSIYPKLKEAEIKTILRYHNFLVVNDTAKHVKTIRGVKGALKKLKNLGFKMALLSNCPHTQIEAILKKARISIKLFDAVIGSDDVEKAKPHPEEILKAKKLLKEKDCFMIGDTTYDILAGKKAKAKTISVLTGDHTLAMLKKEKPDYILKSVAKMPKLMKKLS